MNALHTIHIKKKLLLLLAIAGCLVTVSVVNAETIVAPGGTTSVTPALNAGNNTQQKSGSLAIGDGSNGVKLCLNADAALGLSDTTNCISSWSSITGGLGTYVGIFPNTVYSLGTPPASVPALTPASYTLQNGSVDIQPLTTQQVTTIVRAPDISFCDTTDLLCQSGSRYGQTCVNDAGCPGGGANSCRQGGICRSPNAPHSCSQNSDCGYNATAVYANSGLSGVAAQFNGTLSIQPVNGSNGEICLGHYLGPVCYSSWSSLSTAPSYVKRFTPLPQPLTPQGAGAASRFGAVISGSASFGSAVLGDTSSLPATATCGDGLCMASENASCAVDCGSVAAPVFTPTVHFGSAPPAMPQIDLNLQAANQPSGNVTILVVRSLGQAPTFVPVNGVDYAEGMVYGNSTIVKKSTTTSGSYVTPLPVDTLPAATGTYYYQTFQANAFPRYSAGSAVFPVSINTLYVGINITGKATISGSVNSILCNGTNFTACQAYYLTGTTETLNLETIESGYTPVSWQGCQDPNNTSNCTVTVGGNISTTLMMTKNVGGGACFAPGTMVDTPLGPTAIERLHVGDEVYSYDEITDRTVTSRVTNTIRHDVATYGRITLSDGTQIEVTPNHPFYDPIAQTWQEIGTMHVGQSVLHRQGQRERSVTIVDMEFSSLSGPVYNLTVANQHNYFVSGILVHNKGIQELPPGD